MSNVNIDSTIKVLTSGIDIIHVYMNRSWFAAVW